jgi:Tfp pilus assembly protein PilV
MDSERALAARSHRGFVFGELLIALLLLAVAVSSLAALMYSVSHRPEGRGETACVAADAARGKCVPSANTSQAAASSKLLRSGCETRSVFDQRNCKDTVVSGEEGSDETVVKPRTDSVAMALLAKKQKAQAAKVRSDRGFIR